MRNGARPLAGTALAVAVLAACGTDDTIDPPTTTAARATQRALVAPDAVAADDATALMDWAERAYPQHFFGPVEFGEYQGYQYRYYPRIDNYLGVSGDRVAVYGTLTRDVLQPVGTLADFRCHIRPDECALPQLAYVVPRAGDYFVYRWTFDIDRAPEVIPTTIVFTDSAAGALRVVDTGLQTTSAHLVEGTITGFESGSTACTYTPALQKDAPFPQHVGQRWTSTATRHCTEGTLATATTTVNGSVVAAETLRTPLGSFQTLKTVYTLTSTSAPGFTLITSCWRDITLGRIVRCEEHRHTTPAGSDGPLRIERRNQELVAFATAAAGPVGPTVARFAGHWVLRFAGADNTRCDAMRVDEGGSFVATCIDTGHSDSYPVDGVIDEQGVASATINSGPHAGRRLDGQFVSPLLGSGQWRGASSTSQGTWTATRD